MGNACAKNAPDQVKENKPIDPIDRSALDERERLNEALRQQKRDLEAELARWRKLHGDRMKGVEEELEAVQEESSKILSVGGTSAEMRETAENMLKAELSDAEAAELKQLENNRSLLENHLKQMITENASLDEIAQRTEEGARDLDELVSKLAINLDTVDENALESDEATRNRILSLIADIYRPINRPGDARECIDQCRIDCAECSSQTVRNLKALVHHWKTGDESWYLTKPIRGIICNSLRMGNVPHNPWNCDICHYIDNSDIPIFV